MTRYLAKEVEVIAKFPAVRMSRILRIENVRADALARLASATGIELRRTIPLEILSNRSTDEDLMVNFVAVDMGPSWMDPIRAYIEEGTLLKDLIMAKKLKYKAVRHVLDKGVLYRRGLTATLQCCVHPTEV